MVSAAAFPCRFRACHLAVRALRQFVAGIGGVGAEAVVRAFLPNFTALPSTEQMGVDHLGQQQLVVLAAHAYRADHRVHRQVFQGAGDLHWIGGLGLVDGRAARAGVISMRGARKSLLVLAFVHALAGVHLGCFWPAGVPFWPPRSAAQLLAWRHRQHRAGIEPALWLELAQVVARVARRLEQQHHVLGPGCR